MVCLLLNSIEKGSIINNQFKLYENQHNFSIICKRFGFGIV